MKSDLQTLEKQRPVEECCEGFAVSSDGTNCAPVCQWPCEHGTCASPNVCECDDDYGGPYCNKSNDVGREGRVNGVNVCLTKRVCVFVLAQRVRPASSASSAPKRVSARTDRRATRTTDGASVRPAGREGTARRNVRRTISASVAPTSVRARTARSVTT